jgi:hypothetical protein
MNAMNAFSSNELVPHTGTVQQQNCLTVHQPGRTVHFHGGKRVLTLLQQVIKYSWYHQY